MNTPKYESKVNTKISKLKNDSINENYSLTQTIEKWKYLMIRPISETSTPFAFINVGP
jgi:hypothetical protein